MTDTLSSAWQSVTRHRLRSFLAMAGVAVGVCALTSIMSVEKSWRQAVTDFFAPMDLETVRVAIPAGGNWREVGYTKGAADADDLKAITSESSAVQSATLVSWTTLRAETDDGSALELAVRAVDADFTKTLPDEVREGRLFTAEEAVKQAPVCLLSFEARVWLFGTEQKVIGRYVRLEGHRFQVVGVIAGNRHAGIGTRAVYVPSSWSRAVLKSRYGLEPATEIFARTKDPQVASSQIEGMMRRRLRGDTSRPFTHSLWQVRQAAMNSRTRATLYSGLAGLCALLAAGIGIAALLFVSVAERSREIGIHRALGATRYHIYGEYLLASLMLSSGGAVIGALAGIPAAAMGAFTTRWQPVLDPLAGEMLMEGAKEFPKLSEAALSVSWEAVAIAIVLALFTGATAAFAPASEAAAVEPSLAISRRAGTRTGLRKFLTCLQVGFGVLVLVVLTSYFSVLESQEKAEARELLGQDRLSAICDPIAAMRKPVDRHYLDASKDAMATVMTSTTNMDAIREQTPLLTALTPSVPLRLSVGYGGRTEDDMRVILTTAEAFEYKPELAGEALRQTERAFRRGEAAAVINPDAKERLFGSADPAGKKLSVAGKQFTVIAVRPNPPGMSGSGEVYIPISFYPDLKHRVPPSNGVDFMMEARLDARPRDERRYAEAMAQLRDALLPLLPADYRKAIKLSEQIPETTKQFIFQHKAVAIRGAVGALAVLLVALIGLANMLLVSVHQEVRETGVRRAFGAQRADIALHFMSEGVALSVIGSAAGLLAGSFICTATRAWGGLPISASMFWAAAGSVATVLVGTIISVFPASVAARIQPVEALRYE
jgi:putative ABC transport system permease protein